MFNSPLSINWNLTYRCPLNCGHCYSRNRSIVHELSFEDKVRVARNIATSQVFEVNIGGGEPGLLPELPNLVSVLSSKHVHVNLSASGFGMSPKRLDSLVSHGLGGLFVSLDSVDPERHDQLRGVKGCHEAAIALADAGIARGLKVRFSFVVTRDNLAEVTSMAEFAAAIGATSLDIRRLRLAGNARSMRRLDLDNNSLLTLRKSVASLVRRTLPIRLHLDSSGSKRSRADCPCGKTALTIRDDGAIIICPYNPAILLGNATINPISEVWQAKAGILDQEDTLCGMLGRKKGQ